MAAEDDETKEGPDDGDPDELDEAGAELEQEPDADALAEEDEGLAVLEDDVEVDDVEAPESEDDADADADADADGAATTRTKRRAGDEEDDDDDEILSPDDVEADLDRILKDRLVTAEEEDDEDDEPEDRSEGGDRLQPKRADEQLCSNCFLLVRATAPGCPVGDDACPIFG